MSGNTFTMRSWEEEVVDGPDGGPRIAHVHATLAYSGVIEGTSRCDYLLYYGGDGHDGGGTTSPGLERIEGTVDGRRGSFVIRHEVGFDLAGVAGTWTVVAGSGTGRLAGLSGSGTLGGAFGEESVGYTFDHRFGS
ncbi:hypothetical protein CFN78_03160 [Amycolatopsis antarctica]|uniref:DUF3224 domain-containing protein n=1 Tax=Amycolatopsis antarctica TaxID=1854586 RepID=A0A263DCR5_9PSEU|nr:DUF3224 domain-containing protein [Amycolatopsis antarctica]OZM75175.1 hypothetical protein CFN78_03160 [Amycolatopsis antarctica]